MFNIILNLHVTFNKVKGSVVKKVDVPTTDEQVDRSRKELPKTTLVDWGKLVGIMYYLLRFSWYILLILTNS